MIDLFEYAIYDLQSKNEFQDLLCKTVDELDQEVKKLILYRMKIFAEKKYESKKQDLTRQYEEFRFQLRNDYDLIAVQGYCENCKNEFNLPLHYKDFLSRVGGEAIEARCPGCDGNMTYYKD